MKQSEIKKLSLAELNDKLSETKKAYNDLTMSHAVTPIQNPMQIRAMRRTIARLKTEISAKS